VNAAACTAALLLLLLLLLLPVGRVCLADLSARAL
jgi:hypothetical protein